MKTAIVTGASRGIGKAAADLFEKEGYDVHRVSTAVLDVAERDAVERYVSNFKEVDLLINSAGITSKGPTETMDPKELQRVYEVNVLGTVNFCQLVLPLMKGKGGYIFNIASLRGIHYSGNRAAYNMSKAAVRAFTLTLAKEVREYGIKVTCINPGYVFTDMISKRIREEGLQPDDLLTPEDIAATMLYLTKLSPGAVVEEISMGEIWE